MKPYFKVAQQVVHPLQNYMLQVPAYPSRHPLALSPCRPRARPRIYSPQPRRRREQQPLHPLPATEAPTADTTTTTAVPAGRELRCPPPASCRVPQPKCHRRGAAPESRRVGCRGHERGRREAVASPPPPRPRRCRTTTTTTTSHSAAAVACMPCSSSSKVRRRRCVFAIRAAAAAAATPTL